MTSMHIAAFSLIDDFNRACANLTGARAEAPRQLLRDAWQHAMDTQGDNQDAPETAADYFPHCIDMALQDAKRAAVA